MFQEILKTYGTLNINVDGVKFKMEDFNEATTIELFHRLIFAHIPDNLKGGDKFAWDIFKKYSRGQMQDATEAMLEDLKTYLEEVKEEDINVQTNE
ncbi:MAG: hypothetical protein IMY72_04740 [Bacteroidetes bacterium]|nr:hypothetical protein [Bacteroidota bacterium]